MKMIKAEMATGIFFIIVASWFLLEASKFPIQANSMDMGPAAFPKALAGLVILFSILLIISSVAKRSESIITINRFKNIVLSIILLIIYGIIIPIVGFYIATALFVPGMLWLAGERSWKTIITVLIIFELFALIGFDTLLNVPLP